MAGGRGNQRIERAGGFDVVLAAERLDHALDVASALACILDEVEVLVSADLPMGGDRIRALLCLCAANTALGLDGGWDL